MSTSTPVSTWRPVLAYTALSAVNQMLWLTYAPITTGAARHYGVSSASIGWLAEIFPLLYVVLAVPAGRLLDRGLPQWLGVGAVLTALGALVRLAGADYWVALGGQVLVAVAQPLVLNAVIAVSATYLAERDRARGIAVSSAGVFAGFVLALVLGPAFGAAHLTSLLIVQAAIAVAAAGWLVAALRIAERPSVATPAGSGGDVGPAAAAEPTALRTVWRDPYIRVLLGLICGGFGVFVALTTWLQALLDPAGVSESAAGLMLLALVLAGAVGAAVLPPMLARRGRQVGFVVTSVAVGVAGLVALALAPGVVTGLVVSVVVGLLLLTDLPIVLELAERRAGAAAATAGALVWLAGNAAGLLVALVVQGLLHRPALAFAVLAAVLASAGLLVPALRRHTAEAGGAAQASPGE